MQCGTKYRVRPATWQAMNPVCGRWLTVDHTTRGAQCLGDCIEIDETGMAQAEPAKEADRG